jgi:hypothetical protein
MLDVKITENFLNLHNQKDIKTVVFEYYGEYDPVHAIDGAISEYFKNVEYVEFIDSNMDNPWIRIVIVYYW